MKYSVQFPDDDYLQFVRSMAVCLLNVIVVVAVVFCACLFVDLVISKTGIHFDMNFWRTRN